MADPTPLDWLLRMKAELDARQPAMAKMDAYYNVFRGTAPKAILI